MGRLEELQPNAAVRGILLDSLVTVVSTQWFGSEALELTYKTPAGRVANELLYRHDEARIEIVEQGRPWSFDGDGHLFRLVSEAHRIRLAHLFDPVLAVHTSIVEPLPHQITAVNEAMLSRQPLRFLEAKGRVAGPPTITVTRNEILTSLNKPDHFILAIVEFAADGSHLVHYVRRPFQREPDFGVTSVNYDFAELLVRAEEPA